MSETADPAAHTLPRRRAVATSSAVRCLFFFGRKLRFDVHVAEFAGVEYLAALETLHEFRVLVAGDDLDTGVKTTFCIALLCGKLEMGFAGWM